MKKIKTLPLAELFFKTLNGLTLVAMLLVLFVFIHSEFYPEKYEKIVIKNKGSVLNYNQNNSTPPATYEAYKNNKLDVIYFVKLQKGDKIMLMIKLLFSLVITFLIIKQLINFILSVKNFSTFHGNNSKYFKNMGKYFGLLLIFHLLFVTKSYTMIFPDMVYTSRHINLDLSTYFFLTACLILCFIISEVFKEGEQLRIENDLTI